MKGSISVILPAFNEEARIGKCIEALKLQTADRFECIVVDDGSTDSTADAVRKAVGCDTRFKLFRTENRGLSAARNFGLDKASGDAVFYADADDIPSRNFLQEPMQFLEENDLEIAFFDASLKNEVCRNVEPARFPVSIQARIERTIRHVEELLIRQIRAVLRGGSIKTARNRCDTYIS